MTENTEQGALLNPEPDKSFEFLSPLDGQTYKLPPYDKALFFDASEGHLDELPQLPPAAEFYSKKFTPKTRREYLEEQHRVFAELQLTSVFETFDAHVSDDDPASAAIIALMNANEFAFLMKVFSEWVAASGGQEVGSEAGEG